MLMFALALVIGTLAFAELVAFAYLYVTAGLVAVVALVVIEQLGLMAAVVQFGSISIYPPDIVFSGLLVAALVRVLLRRSISWFELAALLLVAFTGIALLRGVLAYGANAAGNEARTAFDLVAGTFYFSAPNRAEATARALKTVWPILAGLLVVVALMHLGSLYAGISLFGSWDLSRGILGVLNSQATLDISQALLVLLLATPAGTRRSRTSRPVSAATLLGVVVVMQQRTVWVATAAALAAAAWIDVRLLRSFLVRAALFLVVVGLVVGLAVGPQRFLAVPTAVARSAQTTGTFRWRIAGWRALVVEGSATPTTLLFGKPFGAGFNRTFRADGRMWTTSVSPHSQYVRMFVRFGVTGLLLFLGLIVGAVSAHVWRGNPRTSGSRLLVPLGVTLIVFCVTYYLPMEQSVVLGLLVATAPRRRPREATRAPEMPRYLRDPG